MNESSDAVERFPSTAGNISALASAQAPFIVFDQVPYFAIANGVGHVTLTAQRQIAAQADGTVGCDFTVVAHLRASVPTLLSLASAIEGILRLARGAGEPPRRPATTVTASRQPETGAPGGGPPAVTELLPSAAGQISALASAAAPFVFFDKVPFFGLSDGVGRTTLVAQREMATAADGSVLTDYVAVAHLRAGLGALAALKRTIEGVALMAIPRPAGNAN